MAKKKPNLRPDANEVAFRTVQAAIGETEKPVPPSERPDDEKDPEAVSRGRKGGEKGGPARAKKLTDEERREIAKRAATERWKSSDQ